MNKTILCCAGCLLVLTSLAQADNWPHWRGEAGNGVSTTATPRLAGAATKNVKWKVVVPGLGSSSPVVWGDRVFVTSADETRGTKALQFKSFVSIEGTAAFSGTRRLSSRRRIRELTTRMDMLRRLPAPMASEFTLTSVLAD